LADDSGLMIVFAMMILLSQKPLRDR